MIKSENILFFKKNPLIDLEKLNKYDEKEIESFKIADSKSGDKYLYYRNGKEEINVTSSYDPLREGQKIVEGHKNMDSFSHVLFLGTGLGYQIEYFSEKYPGIEFSIYEPSEEIFYIYSSNKIIPTNKLFEIGIGNEKSNIEKFILKMIAKIRHGLLIIEIPSYKNIFKDFYDNFMSVFKQIINDKRSTMFVNYGYQKKWIINSLVNFPKVLNSKNILMAKDKDIFKNKPAILAAAGPSINDEKENLRKIIDEDKAYVFSIGSTIDFFLNHGMKPDVSTVYDPTNLILLDFKKVLEENINDIPLIFGSSCGYELVEHYPGPLLHMIISQDTTSRFFLNSVEKEMIEGIIDAPTIAIITLQLLHKLGFDPIILVGQNLAVRGDRFYADGIEDYDIMKRRKVIEVNEDYMKVPSVDGDFVYTTPAFNGMRKNMETLLSVMKERKIINSTQGGAHIEGTEFIPLSQVMEDYLSVSVEKIKIDSVETSNYDIKTLQERQNILRKSEEKLDDLFAKAIGILKKIRKLFRNQNYQELENEYKKIENTFTEISKNEFYNIYILPMNRVFYDFLIMELAEVKREKNKLKKAEMVIKTFSDYTYICTEDKRKLKSIYENIDTSISDYLDKRGE